MKSCTILARRWFDKSGGNTYHSVTVLIDGKEVINVPFCYGYDSQYLTTATTELQKIDLLPYDFKKEYYTVDRFCRENDIPVYVDCVDVSRKKDL